MTKSILHLLFKQMIFGKVENVEYVKFSHFYN